MNLVIYCLKLKNESKISIPSSDWLPFLSPKIYSFPDGIPDNLISNLSSDH
jgi:hypothetical protein